MRLKIKGFVKLFLYHAVTAALIAMILFLLAGVVFPRAVKRPGTAAPAYEAALAAATSEAIESAGTAGAVPVESPELPPKPSAAREEDALPALSTATVQVAQPETQSDAEGEETGKDKTSQNPDERDNALALDAGEDQNKDADEPKKKEKPQEPPSLLEIISRSIFSYKTLLSHEMPLIYGTEYLSNDVEKLMEEEMAPEEISEEIKLEITRIDSEKDKKMTVTGTGAQVLIYHTHTLEAYRQVKGAEYVESSRWRTKDKTKSVVHIGELLEKELEKYDFEVLHDDTNHEPPDLNSSYSRSLKTMKKYKENNKSLRVFIDVHRDASSDKNDVVTVDGKRCARVMFVVGMGKSSSVKPDWKQSYKLAKAVTDELEKIKKGFTRDVRVKEVRSYNQYVSDMCMLIEVGHNANTLEEAENTVPYLAKAISEVIRIEK